MKIGIQILAYNCSDSFERLIKPWVNLKKHHDIKIWVGSGQFKEYAELGYKDLNHSTEVLLGDLLLKGDIDYVFKPDRDNLLTDAGTRDKCIPWMKENDIDLMIQVDADEFYSAREAKNLIEYCIENPEFDHYNTIFKQVIGDGIVEDWKRFSAGWIKRYGGIKSYYFDMHWWFNDNFDYRQTKGIDIPKHKVNPYHYTWTNDGNTTGPSHIKEKIAYQNRIYKDGCGYEWDETTQTIVKKEKVSAKVNLVFSTARRYKHFQLTFNSLIKYNPELVDIVDKVYILDDRSTWEDRKAMESDVSDVFGSSNTTTVTFNGEEEFDWIDKLNFISNLSNATDYILFIEDDWESTDSMNLQVHLNFLNKNKQFDLITFNGWFHLQNTQRKDKWDYVKSYNDVYFQNPYPNGMRHVIKEKDGVLGWVGIKINNFSLNPSLYRSNIFSGVQFNKTPDFEMKFAGDSKLKQLLVKKAPFLHRGDEESLHNRINNNNITI